MKKHCPVACKGVTEKLHTSGGLGKCQDLHPRCPIWEGLGECVENPGPMNRYCKKSCGKCGSGADGAEGGSLCMDQNENCAFWASKGECKANPNFMEVNCAKSCNTCDKYLETTKAEEAAAVKAAEAAEEAAGSSTIDAATKQRLLDWSETVGVRQNVAGTSSHQTFVKIQKAKNYWEKDATEALPADLLARCRNLHELCAFWAEIGR